MRVLIPLSGRAAAGAALFALVFAAVPAAARAEGGLFGAFLNAIGRVIAPPRNYSSPAPEEVPGNSLSDAFTHGNGIRPAEGGPQVAFCVRTCDGRYFPIAKNGAATPAKMCRSMCPSAATEIYSGNAIENAVSPRGESYSSLANAFVYRDRLVEGCSCNAKKPVGNTNISYTEDPTLRPGDIVMTENGPVVFRGQVGPTHKLSDFVPARDSKQISGALREQVVAMRVLQTKTKQASMRKAPAQNATAAVEAAAAVGNADARARALGFAE